MRLQRIAPILILLLVASVAIMAFAAGRDDRALTAIAAAAYCGLIVAVAVGINVLAWRDTAATADDAIDLLQQNARLAALVYTWGAAAMVAVYCWSGLTWRHGWQYSLYMALIAAGLHYYERRLGDKLAMPPLWPTALHGAAALAALVYLIGSNKLATLKSDWAANGVFLYGGLAILALCIIASISQTRQSHR